MNYQEFKKQIMFKSVDFYNTDDLILLANAYLKAEEVLKQQDFPIKEYRKYSNKLKDSKML